jgi:hypothetical protein
MISVTHLQKNLNRLFHLASSEGIEFKVKHGGSKKVYLLSLQPLVEEYKASHWILRKRLANRKKGVAISMKLCEVCGYVKAASICINNSCPSNKG